MSEFVVGYTTRKRREEKKRGRLLFVFASEEGGLLEGGWFVLVEGLGVLDDRALG